MIEARNVKPWAVDAAKNFIRKHLSEGFRAWTTLRDRDNVTMTIHELAHLMAWYAQIQLEARGAAIVERPGLGEGNLALPEKTEEIEDGD